MRAMTYYRPFRLALPLLAATVLAACQAEPEKQAAVQGDPHQGIELPPGHPAIAGPGQGDAQTSASASGHPPVISLDGEGLRLVDPKSGATRPLSFGIGEAQLKMVAERLKGPAKAGRNTECGAGPLASLSWDDGLTLYALDGLFAGWALDERGAPSPAAKAAAKGEPPARLTTISGIGIGSTRAQLLDVYDAKIEQTSLGTEFNAAGLSGILDGEGEKAKVTNLWSGVNCVFR
jgi:hypothetical protein